ncbi:hypothetical protein EDC01DRAFT_318263 [Geopyxis carbonaria]|nr:hypothetical protein EDC01DRAFT_318263 [Geopyxis carbonaria]
MPVTRRSQSAEPEPQPQPRRPRSRANSREPPPSNRNLLKPSKGLARKTASKRDEATPVVLNMEEGDQQRGGANGGGPVLAPVVEEAESTPMRPKTAATPTETQSSSQEQGTQLEASDIDPLLALDNLPDLNQSADKILKLLGTDIEKQQNDLLQPESMLSRRLNNFRNAFIQQKRTLGNAEYIHAKAVQQVLDTARFTPILHKVNMAVLAIFLNTCQLGTRHAWQEFQNIERDYPTQVGMVIDTSEKFKLVLDMRTHTTLAGIATMSSDPELSHREIIQAFFFEQESNRGRTRLRPWENITYKNWGKETRARIKILIDAFNDDTDPFEAIQEMRERFPWVEFASRTANYIRTTYKEPIFQNKVKAAVRAAEIMVENGTPPPEDLQETTIEDITEGSNANTSAGSARPDVGDATDGDFPNLPEDVYENERLCLDLAILLKKLHSFKALLPLGLSKKLWPRNGSECGSLI